MKHMSFLTLSACLLALSSCQTTGLQSSGTNIPYGITPADSHMDCTQMQAEFNQMDQIIANAQNQNPNQSMTQTGTQVAQQAMKSSGYGEHSGILGSLSGMARQMTSANQQNMQQQAKAAQVRRDQLLQLAYQKGCIQGVSPQTNYQQGYGGYRPY